ncbi:FCD domain-containing protein [Haloechinothrix sp. LS1_15]|uniref:FadR/GntR family transcriptional regulator n=1 Tax=Haloechinothrix sp. LS1_15 TaxID=2652248 RepID=UPI00294AA45B|nr:FCD domain-containing protein [Haloechinothrix sp. LS1_15]
MNDSSATTGPGRHVIFAPVAGGARVDVVARRISEAIALGLLADGEQLPSESELAVALNVSTVTLREALSSLRQQGLVETRRGRGGGSFVRAPADASIARLRRMLREYGVHELREIGDHHVAIAGTAARLAAERASADHLTRLEALISELADAGSVGDRRRADGRFHIEIAAAAQSTRLTRQEIDLQGEIGELLWLPFGEAVQREEVVAQHKEILAAIASGDGKRARECTEHHIEQAIARLIHFHLQLAKR